MVIKKKDWDENFLSLKMKIIMMDDIQVKTQIQKKEIYKVFNLEKLKKLLNSRETLYFMSSN